MKKAGNKVDRFFEILLIVVLAFLCIIVFLNVIGRTFFRSMTWSVELSRFLFVYFIFLSAIVAMKERIHFRVDLLVNLFPEKIQKFINIISDLLVLFALYVIFIGSWKLVIINRSVSTAVLGIPFFYLYGVGIVTAIAMGIFILHNLVRSLMMKNTEGS